MLLAIRIRTSAFSSSLSFGEEQVVEALSIPLEGYGWPC